jgi:hypothetical protein
MRSIRPNSELDGGKISEEKSSSSIVNQGVASTSLERTLQVCLDMLRLDHKDIRQKCLEIIQKVPFQVINRYGDWIIALKSVAELCAVGTINFSESQICDFLTVAAKGTETKEMHGEIVENMIFYIYKDIMENYKTLKINLKRTYPQIIVDVLSIIHIGVDTQGKIISVYNLNNYYQMRKTNSNGDYLKSEGLFSNQPSFLPTSLSSDRHDNNSPHDKEMIINKNTDLDNRELVESLQSITGRSTHDLELLVQKLQSSDKKKISDLCINFKKLQKYSNLLGTKSFGDEVQKELGRNLTDRQLLQAAVSIKKVKTYIENILDDRFSLHSSHGINHVKHNLEYGYQIMGLIKHNKRNVTHKGL